MNVWILQSCIATKLDGDTRGGGNLSIRSVTGKPIKFTGRGEKVKTSKSSTQNVWLLVFLVWGYIDPYREGATRLDEILKAQRVADKIKANIFDFNDFIRQLDQVRIRWDH